MSIHIKAIRLQWISIAISLLMLPQYIDASDIFVTSKIAKNKLQWGEPCAIELSVYTQTWFTEGVIFPEMKTPNGILIKNDRSYTSSEVKHGIRYNTVSQGYLYYPLALGPQTIGFDDIAVYSPLPGKFKGEKRVFSFPTKEIDVRLAQEQTQNMTTARKLELSQNIDIPDTLRQGDVITRIITCKATGVPAAFIAMPEPDNTPLFCKVIAETPTFTTFINNTSILGKASRTYLYQLTDSGTFRIPDFELVYWHTSTQKRDTLRVEGIEITVLPVLQSEKSSDAVVGDLTNKKVDEKRNIYLLVFIAIPFVLLALFRKRIVRWNAQWQQSPYWIILRASTFPRLYNALYKIAIDACFSNFSEMSALMPKSKPLYDRLLSQLFKNGDTGPCSLKLRLSFLRVIYKLRKQ